MGAWTKGPLVLRDARDRANPEGPFIAPAGGSPTTCLTGYYPAAETAANGALYAAAPDLAEALEALQRQALQSPDLRATEWGQEALEMARAALKKAKGEA